MSKGKPNSHLRKIRNNLDKSKSLTAKALDDIIFQQEVLEAISPYWDRKFVTSIKFAIVNSFGYRTLGI